MANSKVHLTQPRVDAIPLTHAGQQLYWDSKLSGFGLLVGVTTRTYIVQADVAGRSVRGKVGRAGAPPEWRANEARAEATQLLAQMKRGKNPFKERRAAEARGITLREAWVLYQDTLKHKGRSARTIEVYGASLKDHLSDWMDRPLADHDRAALRVRHENIAKRIAQQAKAARREKVHGKGAANNAMRALRAVWNRARREHEELVPCPVESINWFRLPPRKSAVATSDLPDLSKKIEGRSPRMRDFFTFCLFTGMRRRATAEMRWEHVDLKAGTLFVPRPKGGEEREFVLPLSKFLTQLLRARKADNETDFPGSPWVFPAHSKSGHLEEPKKRGHKSAHAMRHTWETAATNAGIHVFHQMLLGNHALPRNNVTAGYVAPSVEDLRKSQERVTEFLLDATGARKRRKARKRARTISKGIPKTR